MPELIFIFGQLIYPYSRVFGYLLTIKTKMAKVSTNSDESTSTSSCSSCSSSKTTSLTSCSTSSSKLDDKSTPLSAHDTSGSSSKQSKDHSTSTRDTSGSLSKQPNAPSAPLSTHDTSGSSSKQPNSQSTHDTSGSSSKQQNSPLSTRDTSGPSSSISTEGCPSLPQLSRSGTVLPPSIQPKMDAVREQIKDRLALKQEVFPLPDGKYMHRCHVVFITLVDGIPLSTHLTMNVKSKNKDSKIVMDEMRVDGKSLYQKCKDAKRD